MAAYHDKCMLKQKPGKCPFTSATAFLSHPQHYSFTETGNERSRPWCCTRKVCGGKISGQLTKQGKEFSLCVLPGFQHHQGEKPLKELLETLPTNESCRDSAGTAGLPGAPFPLSSQRVPPLWLAGCRWCTAGSGFPSSLLHHRTCQTSILKQFPRLLYACRYKVQPKICIYIYKRKKKSIPRTIYFSFIFQKSFFLVHQDTPMFRIWESVY